MSKRLVAGILTGVALLLGAELYKFRKGIPEEHAAIADFNNDGKKDMVYLYGEYNNYSIWFVDGRDLKEQDGKYLRTSIGEHIGALPDVRRKYDLTATDMNGDGNEDLVVRSGDLRQDTVLYANVREIYLGDGKGNFKLSPDSNLIR